MLENTKKREKISRNILSLSSLPVVCGVGWDGIDGWDLSFSLLPALCLVGLKR